MVRLFLFAAILLTQCKTIDRAGDSFRDVVDHVADGPLPPLQFDEDLEPFVGEFQEAAERHGVIIDPEMYRRLRQVKWVDNLSTGAGESVLAVCVRYRNSGTWLNTGVTYRWLIVEIHRERAEAFTRENRIRLRELVFHELFHCLLNKGHLPDGVSGIMSATLHKGSRRALRDWNNLVEEMFSKKYIDMIPQAESAL